MLRNVKSKGRIIQYTLIRNAAKNVIMRAPEPEKLNVYAPAWMKLKDIDNIVIENADKVFEMWVAYEKKPIEDGAKITIEGTPRILHILYGAPNINVTETDIFLTIQKSDDARDMLTLYLYRRALERIRERLKFFAPDAVYGRVAVREQRTRWGSCSSKHNLNFNWKLILAPSGALDYVVVHELAHITYFDHSPRFWALVGQMYPDYEYWKSWLKQNGKNLNI